MAETIFNIPIMVNKSMATDLTSDVTDLSKADGFSVQAQWTGSCVGILQLEFSTNGVRYVVDPDSLTAVNGDGDAIWEIDTTRLDKVQLHFVRTSGTGTINAQICAKGDFR